MRFDPRYKCCPPTCHPSDPFPFRRVPCDETTVHSSADCGSVRPRFSHVLAATGEAVSAWERGGQGEEEDCKIERVARHAGRTASARGWRRHADRLAVPRKPGKAHWLALSRVLRSRDEQREGRGVLRTVSRNASADASAKRNKVIVLATLNTQGAYLSAGAPTAGAFPSIPGCSVTRMISARCHRRMRGPQVPVPRDTMTVVVPSR